MVIEYYCELNIFGYFISAIWIFSTFRKFYIVMRYCLKVRNQTNFTHSLFICKLLSREGHPYHIVSRSVFPIFVSNLLLIFLLGFVLRFTGDIMNSYKLVVGGFYGFTTFLTGWVQSIIHESEHEHTKPVQLGLTYGMSLFIISEIFFFFSFFWAFFYGSISPSIQLGAIWPPKGIRTISFIGVPFVNTLVLVSSGVCVSHGHAVILRRSKYLETLLDLFSTILYGLGFTWLQVLEYIGADFNISDSVYSSIFFLATGFHGFHVSFGTLFLFVCFIRHSYGNFTAWQHFGAAAAIWYWHFVDIVWLFLYVVVYWWGA